MRRLVTLVTVLGAAACAAAPSAFAQHQHGAEPTVSAGFDSFSPPQATALAGESVMWMNDSARTHTVTANDGSFDSERLPVGGMFEHRFTTSGAFAYHCTLHPFMTGEVDVYDVLLDAPSGPAGPRLAYPIRGRSALPSGTPVTIEANSGAGFAPAATAMVAADGTFAASVVRAITGDDSSPPVQLIVVDHTVTASVKRLKGHRVQVDATVTPASPGSRVVLQLHLRERFGWWPETTLRLDRNSHARFVFRSRSRVPARVALTLPDGATVLATSAVKRRY